MKTTNSRAGRAGRRSRTYILWAPVAVVLVVVAALLLSACSVPGSGDETTTSGQGSDTTQGAVWQDGSPSTTAQQAGEQISTTVSSGDSTAAADQEQSPAVVAAERLGPSVVNVAVEGVVDAGFGQQQYSGVGSGVIISSDGNILTNNHVVSQEAGSGQFVNADKITVTLATGEELPAQIVGTDPLTDLAVISVQKNGLPAAEFVDDFSSVKIGQYAVAIGSPLGYENSVTLGIISGVFRDLPVGQSSTEQFALVDLIQTDAAISPGNSGGALADAEGKVIGINVAYVPPGTGAQNLGFAIPADVAQSVATQLVETGRVAHAFMGIRTRPVDSALQQQFGLSRDTGVLVVNVDPGSPAANAGLQQGDIIYKVDDRNIDTDSNLFGFLRGKMPGDTVLVSVDRNGQTVTVRVTLTDRPQ